MNLLGNVLKYTKKGQISVLIYATDNLKGQDILLVGIGLGLSIVCEIVRTLDGNIRIKSRVGEGTTVRVIILLECPVGEKSLLSTPLRRKAGIGATCGTFLITSNEVDREVCRNMRGRSPLSWRYGLRLVSWSVNELINVLLANESDLSIEGFLGLYSVLLRMLIFRNCIGSSSDVRIQWLYLADSMNLARGILNCLYLKLGSSALPALRLNLSE
ncbi:hypothetical protein N7478_003939 [Penicillium angulare]|uniref:uncharacterized protein n=1 Tax=Penicillium angulare TaxID=116970 RepID=UPI0025420B32|nr:uncharacterized protein N7478_003939 [Penicillium angulare]KAJ5288253.1 hypothetical protein N7478_003939 [Penicillium angulare]